MRKFLLTGFGWIGGLAMVMALVLGMSPAGAAVQPRVTSLACYGSLSGHPLNKPIVGIASTPDSAGYWMVASDGGVFTFGDAAFYGSAGALHLNKPIVGMAATPDGHGYWLVASDGGIFTYGDAGFYGSAGSLTLNKPIVGMAATPDGHGYWLVASDGGIFTYGDAPFYGSAGSIHLNQPVVGMAATADGHGYWLAAADAGVFSYGDATYLGGGPISQDGAPAVRDFSSFVATSDGAGYLIADSSRSFLLNFGTAKYFGLKYSATDLTPLAGITAPQAGTGYSYWEATAAGSVFALTASDQVTC